jgi:hypothetical protein
MEHFIGFRLGKVGRYTFIRVALLLPRQRRTLSLSIRGKFLPIPRIMEKLDASVFPNGVSNDTEALHRRFWHFD